MSNNPASINFQDANLHQDRSGRAVARKGAIDAAIEGHDLASHGYTEAELDAARALLARRTV